MALLAQRVCANVLDIGQGLVLTFLVLCRAS